MNGKIVFAPMPRENISDGIVNLITQQLINGELLPGDRLPTELEFCEKLNVSRNVVREAVKILVALGVVEIRRAEGTFIVKEYTQRLLNPIMYGLILSDRNMAELLEVNISMLREILSLSKGRILSDELDALNGLHKELTECMLDSTNDIDRMAELSTQFYSELCKTSKNTLMFHIYDVLLRIFSSARRRGFENAVARDCKEKHLQNYDFIMELLNGHSEFSIDYVCTHIHEAWKDILL